MAEKPEDIQRNFELRERRLKLVYRILYIIAIAWGVLFFNFMKIEVHSEQSAAYCGMLAIVSVYLLGILKYIIKELSCMKISDAISEDEEKQADDFYNKIWKNSLLTLVIGIIFAILHIWGWKYFIQDISLTQGGLSIAFLISSIYFIVYSFAKKMQKSKKVIPIINNIASIIFSYLIYAIILIA